jgi:hypothetical protein
MNPENPHTPKDPMQERFSFAGGDEPAPEKRGASLWDAPDPNESLPEIVDDPETSWHDEDDTNPYGPEDDDNYGPIDDGSEYGPIDEGSRPNNEQNLSGMSGAGWKH